MNTLTEDIIREQKSSLRARYRAVRRSIVPKLKKENDTTLCELYLASELYRRYDTLLLYRATPEEPDIARISDKALADGKAVAYSRCDTATHTLTFHFITSPSQLIPSSYGLYEPDAELPVFDITAASDTLCIVPGVVFDRRGYRVGMGGGYYDRFLSGFTGFKLGVTFSDFIISAIPNNNYDIRMDAIITEEGVRLAEKY